MKKYHPAMTVLTAAVIPVLMAVIPSNTLAALSEGCTMKIMGDSLVLAGETPGSLCFNRLETGSVSVRSTYRPSEKGTVIYEEGRDYTVDLGRGTITRTPMSRIPDFRKNVLYAKKNFDHNKFPGYGNHPYFIWVDYITRNGSRLAVETNQKVFLSKTRAKLLKGGPFKIIVFGDSISTGDEASLEALRFQSRYAKALGEQFPKAQITVENGATGGDNTVNGLARLEDKVLSRSPDLVLVGFGMNDHNVLEGGGVTPEQFQKNLGSIVESIRKLTGADVILLSTFPPHPDWMYGTHQMGKYAEATKFVASSVHCAYADVYSVWDIVLKRKDASSLLGNNINHPNDFGHWLYFLALEAVRF